MKEAPKSCPNPECNSDHVNLMHEWQIHGHRVTCLICFTRGPLVQYEDEKYETDQVMNEAIRTSKEEALRLWNLLPRQSDLIVLSNELLSLKEQLEAAQKQMKLFRGVTDHLECWYDDPFPSYGAMQDFNNQTVRLMREAGYVIQINTEEE